MVVPLLDKGIVGLCVCSLLSIVAWSKSRWKKKKFTELQFAKSKQVSYDL